VKQIGSGLFTLMVVAMSACSGRSGNPEHDFRVREVDGILVASNTGGPRFSENLFLFEKELSLVQDPGRPESLLSRPTDLFRDEEGVFYVEDGSNCRIAVFDREGQYVRDIGRQGSGPGEFSRFGWGLAGLEDGVLTVHDYMLRRTTRYRTDGSLLEVIPRPAPVSGVNVTYLPVSGTYIVVGEIFEPGESVARMGATFRTISADGDTIGMAGTATVPSQYLIIRPWAHPTNQRMWLPIPFTSSPEVLYIRRKGILMTTGAEPVLRLYELEGRLLKEITLDLPPRPVTQREKNERLRILDERIEQSEGTAKEEARVMRREIRFPEHKAFWTWVRCDDRGYLWLEVPESEEEKELQGGGYLYRVLDPEGEYLGTARTPVRGIVRHGRLLGFVTDPETDERIPTVWRLVPQARGFRYP
jgi:hypothetical protein